MYPCERCDLPRDGRSRSNNSGLEHDCIRALKAEIIQLRGEVTRLEHIVAVLKGQIGMAYQSAETIEDHTRIHEGRLEAWFLGEWVDVEKERSRVTDEEPDEPQKEK